MREDWIKHLKAGVPAMLFGMLLGAAWWASGDGSVNDIAFGGLVSGLAAGISKEANDYIENRNGGTHEVSLMDAVMTAAPSLAMMALYIVWRLSGQPI